MSCPRLPWKLLFSSSDSHESHTYYYSDSRTFLTKFNTCHFYYYLTRNFQITPWPQWLHKKEKHAYNPGIKEPECFAPTIHLYPRLVLDFVVDDDSRRRGHILTTLVSLVSNLPRDKHCENLALGAYPHPIRIG